MITPITFESHYVTYKVINAGVEIQSKNNASCFSSLFQIRHDIKNEIELLNFLRVETAMYAPEFIKKISRICGVKTIFISENHIRVSGFKNLFLTKTFLTMYRLLFESNKGYGMTIENVIKQRILFFEAFINKSDACEYRCNLKRFIYFHNLHIKNTLGNSNHCMKGSSTGDISIKSRLQLLNHTGRSRVHDFFN